MWKISEKEAVNKIIMLFRSVEDNKGLFVFELSAVSYIETVFTQITLSNIVEEKQYLGTPLFWVSVLQNLILKDSIRSLIIY